MNEQERISRRTTQERLDLLDEVLADTTLTDEQRVKKLGRGDNRIESIVRSIISLQATN